MHGSVSFAFLFVVKLRVMADAVPGHAWDGGPGMKAQMFILRFAQDDWCFVQDDGRNKTPALPYFPQMGEGKTAP